MRIIKLTFHLQSSTNGVDHSAKPPCPTVQKSHSSELEQSIKRIGTMFRRDTTASEIRGQSHDSSPGEDPTEGMITRIRHVSGVTSHSPTVVTPDRSSGGSFPPFEAGVVPEVAVAGHWEDEGSVISEYSASNYSQASAPIDHVRACFLYNPQSGTDVSLHNSRNIRSTNRPMIT